MLSLTCPVAASAPFQRSEGSIRASAYPNSRNAARATPRIPLVSRPIATAAAARPFLLDDFDDDDDSALPARTPADYASLLSDAEKARDWVRAVELVAEARVLRVKLTAEAFESAARVAADEGDWEKAAAFLARAMISPSLVADSSLPPPPACSAIVAVFSRLAREVQAEAMMELLEMLRGEEGDDDDGDDVGDSEEGNSSSSSSSSSSSWRSRPAETRSITLNCAARACARASTGGAKMMSQNDDGSDKTKSDDDDGKLSEEDRAIFFESSLRLLDDLREESLRIEDGTFGAVALAALAAGRPDLSEELLEERDYL